MAYQIIVIFGGVSNENEISIITGTMTCSVLKKGGNTVLPVYIAQDGTFYGGTELCDITLFRKEEYRNAFQVLFDRGGVWLKNKKNKLKRFFSCDCVINCCHGGAGEGGGIAGLCALYGLPLASAGMFESAAFLDKYLTKILLKGLNVPTLPYVVARSIDDTAGVTEVLGDFPYIVKPLSLGSSIGVRRVDTVQELEFALSSALALDQGALIERCLTTRREINCAACRTQKGIELSVCEESLTDGAFLSFDDKYAGGGRSVCPADLNAHLDLIIRQTTGKVYEKLNMRGIVRFDYLVEGEEVYLSEVNTVPGSLAYYLFDGGKRSLEELYPLLISLIEFARKEQAESKNKTILQTGILTKYLSNCCKRGAK
jgi:D-alanine-D-alanine ligase